LFPEERKEGSVRSFRIMCNLTSEKFSFSDAKYR